MYLITALHLYLITAHSSTDTAIMIPTELPNYITMSPQIKTNQVLSDPNAPLAITDLPFLWYLRSSGMEMTLARTVLSH